MTGTTDESLFGTQVMFGDVAVDVIDLEHAVEHILDLSQTKEVEVVVTPNVDHLVLYRQNSAFASTYDRASLVLADGMPLILMARLLRLPLRDKVSGSDLIEPLVARAAERNVNVFMLGATSETTAEASKRLVAQYPELKIVGQESPWFSPGEENGDVAAALESVRSSGADLVLLAFGAPKQEQLIAEFADLLPPACYLCCGASLDFAAGHISRAPSWMSRFGLEWLYRLAREPKRLWKRYVLRDSAALPLFVGMIARRIRGRDLTRRRPSGQSFARDRSSTPI